MREEITIALVREFLSCNGCKRTLGVLDEERPRDASSITKRSELARHLRLERHVKRNKEAVPPISSTLGIMVQYLLDKARKGSEDGASRRSAATAAAPEGPSRRRGQASPLPGAEDGVLHAPIKRRGARPPASPAASSGGPVATGRASPARPSLAAGLGASAVTTGLSGGRRSDRRRDKPARAVTEDLVFEDVDEGDLFGSAGGQARVPAKPRGSRTPGGLGIGTFKAAALRKLMFGASTGTFSQEWTIQSLGFCDLPGLTYGLVQLKGGSCGVLAVVQAFLLKHLLFGPPRESPTLEPSVEERAEALVAAICEILLQCAPDGKTATVCMPAPRGAARHGRDRSANLTENMLVHKTHSRDALGTVVRTNLAQFVDPGSLGVINLLYSAILTRGIERVREDMDEPGGRLMGQHAYGTQDMVNLLLFGRACSNVHDGDKVLGDGVDKLVLKGVPRQSEIGLLSLFEHYKSCEVGSSLKTPRLPIWVVCAESHFTVLFSEDMSLLSSRSPAVFDMHYYDQLGQFDEPYRLTIDASRTFPIPDEEKTAVPPVDHCIRTRWPKCRVTWNGVDPIL